MFRADRSLIHRHLKAHGFLPTDFSVTDSQENDRAGRLSITFIPDPRYTFEALVIATNTGEIAATSPYQIHSQSRPGELLERENATHRSTNELLSAIGLWVDRLDKELSARPLAREIERQQQEIEQLASQFVAQAEGFFSREEANELARRLEEFESSFKEHIQATAASNGEAERKVRDLHAEIELLKKRLDQMQRKAWFRTFTARFVRWANDPENQELLKAGRDVARTILLGPGPNS